MKTLFLTMFWVLLGFSLTHCKEVQFSADGNILIQSGSNDTDLRSIQFSEESGGFQTPYKADLDMFLNEDGTVRLQIDQTKSPPVSVTCSGSTGDQNTVCHEDQNNVQPQGRCTINRLTGDEDFMELAGLIDSSTKYLGQLPPDVEDNGHGTLYTTNVYGRSLRYELWRPNTMSGTVLIFENPAPIQKKLEEIIARYCNNQVPQPVPMVGQSY